MKTRVFRISLQIFLITFSVFFFVSLVINLLGLNNLYIQSEDTLPSIFLPVTLIKEGTLNLDAYVPMLLQKYPHPDDTSLALGLIPFYLKPVGEHFLSAFPILPGLLAIPVYVLPLLAGMPITWFNLGVLAHITSSIIVALSCVVLFNLLSRHFLLDGRKSILVTYIYAFATLNFSVVSQGLWQHGPLELFTLLGMYYLYEKKYFLSGLFLSLAILSRPTALLPFCLLFCLIAINTKYNLKSLFKYSLGLIPSLLFFIWYTLTSYQGIQNNGYADQLFTEWRSNIIEGLFGLWISPSKGLLVFTPLFIFSIYGFVYALKNFKKDRSLVQYISFGVIVFVHTLVLGKWKHWYGGWSYGYRMASDIIPFLVLLLLPFIDGPYYEKYKKIFYLLIFVSVLIQISGLIFFDGVWHAAYDKGYQHTSWLWSIQDSQFAFDIRRILVKIGLLDKACPICL